MKNNTDLITIISVFEDEYWWYTARREIIQHLISERLKENSRVLNVGCGTGGDSRCIAKCGADVFNTDYSFEALTLSRSKGNRNHFRANCEDLPVEEAFFDLVLCLDVIEHVEKDTNALREIRRVMKPGDSRLLLTVPAYNWMWTSRDKLEKHCRRYTKKVLANELKKAGFEINLISYFNTLLFPVALVDLLINRIRQPRSKINYFPRIGKKVNNLLREIFSFEKQLISKAGLPFGKSIVVICRPRNN